MITLGKAWMCTSLLLWTLNELASEGLWSSRKSITVLQNWDKMKTEEILSSIFLPAVGDSLPLP